MYTVYGDIYSGNCYKVKLLLNQLELEHQWIALNVVEGDTRTPSYLSKNANGKIPLLERPDGSFLPESGAILWYLAEDSDYLPDSREARARILQWMFFEQYSHEPYIAVARFIVRYLDQAEAQAEVLTDKRNRGYHALDVMEDHLARHRFLAADGYTIADIALYAYTHCAHEGGFHLNDYPAIRAWLGRVEDQPRHITMDATAAA